MGPIALSHAEARDDCDGPVPIRQCFDRTADRVEAVPEVREDLASTNSPDAVEALVADGTSQFARDILQVGNVPLPAGSLAGLLHSVAMRIGAEIVEQRPVAITEICVLGYPIRQSQRFGGQCGILKIGGVVDHRRKAFELWMENVVGQVIPPASGCERKASSDIACFNPAGVQRLAAAAHTIGSRL